MPDAPATEPDPFDSTPVPRSFFDRPVLQVAPDLLGRVLAHDSPEGLVTVRLTEVEAYDGPNDPGSHAYRGLSKRNVTMFGPPGHVYVYFTYGMHYCMNLVCGAPNVASAVLLRGATVVDGIELARKRRHAAKNDNDLARGPARLVEALGIGRADDGADVCGDGPLVLLRGDPPPADRIRTGPRVGLREAADFPWRFWIDAEPTVSTYRPHVPKRRTS
ncbi:MAG TPA: DNA-3-methyladenine glycosylase [Actinocrinis sp.]|jgi:DNA-3-methyladenine glycosylase|uniref:DNA-3-methyladenine glycosylase n=1 Tax=Actinocrinis sp. TaxID=1920516 RepID=UPI002DDCCB5D|nr:DNA-3-methyladenine glycosylase [Actinocrinis sp.]HEV3169217.1 DNA-3-methyladenine glycosylase [Actinocrinis sp.]